MDALAGSAAPAGHEDDEPPPTIELGLVVTPALDAEAVARLVADLEQELAQRYPGVKWHITPVRDSLVTPPATLPDIVDAARYRLLDGGWDLVVHITDLPLRVARRPLVAHSSRSHSAAIVSLPALGPTHTGRRLVNSVADAVGLFVGDRAPREERIGVRLPEGVRLRLRELASDVEGSDALDGMALLHRVVTGNARLLMGMVRANHPSRLIAGLSRAIIGAVGVATFAVVTSDVWRIAASIGSIRLAAVCLATIACGVITLIAVHGLWERAADRALREQAMLFNLVTLITVAFGIVALYLTVCLLGLAAALLLIDRSLMAATVNHAATFADYVRLALLGGALATLGGALGSALESDAAVREAAYGYRPQDQP